MWFLKRVSVLILFISFGYQSAYASQDSSTISKIIADYGSAVVMIGTASEDEELGFGSGFIVKSDGTIITNYHVIEGANEIGVRLINGKIFEDISIIQIDKEKDIAVIKINGTSLPTVKLGDSDQVNPGDKIVVIGNPKGLENTVTDGLISGIRDIDEGFKVHQISAPISSGSSGSPVFNLKGEVIGIAQGSFTEAQNLNFSIPINYVRSIIGAAAASRTEAMPKVARQGGGTKIPYRTESNPLLIGIIFFSVASIVLIVFIFVTMNRRTKKTSDLNLKIVSVQRSSDKS